MARMQFLPDWKMIWRYLRDGSSDWKPKAIAVIAIVYLLWPIDLLPDLAPLIGWLDDLGFVGLASWYLVAASSAYAKRLGKGD
jgi:uncharacterized membrane protein YkvA (DUF1232 family)